MIICCKIYFMFFLFSWLCKPWKCFYNTNFQIYSKCPEVGHGWTLLNEMAEVSLIDFSYLNRLALSTFTEVGPQFSNQDSRLGPVIEKN